METLFDIDIPTIVEHKTNLFNQFDVVSIILMDLEGKNEFSITPAVFMKEYREYINPMQLEINRLLAENKKLKEQLKPLRKPRRRLLAGELEEIKKLLETGATNPEIATEYKVSPSTISKIRSDLRKEFDYGQAE